MLSIETPLGRMRGAEHNGCLAFRGIRYAKAPVGALRFRPPEPVESWSALYDATEFGPSAPQPAMFMPGDPLQLPTEPTDEDCLFLNVYTPAVDGPPRPVLFWIHGGGYVAGSGRIYDGSVFAREHDVVVVTINYRLGPLGFTHVGHLESDLASSVNNGILDQICALEWTRDNIHVFGGDPNNVMIFGESAGGTFTATLLGCPSADGLYHKASVHSPNVDLLEVGRGHVEFTNRCIRRLGGDPETNGMATLRGASAEELIGLTRPQRIDPDWTPRPDVGIRSEDNVWWAPVIDGTLIPAPVAETVRGRGENNVPFLGGGCRHEGTLFAGMLGGSEVGEAEAIELLNAAGCDGERAIEAYEDFAPGSSAREKLTYALTDTLFRNSMVRIMDAAADAGSKCWSWMCTWESDLENLRATHAMDLVFLWDWVNDPAMQGMRRFAGSDPPEDLGRVMREYWVNFARTGEPSAHAEPEWIPYNTTNRPVLLLDAERRIESNFDDGVRQLWFGA